MILTLMTIFTFIHVKVIMKIKLVELAFLCQLFLYACITQYGLYVYINYIDLYDLYKHITEFEELKQCLRHIKTGTAKIFFLAFPSTYCNRSYACRQGRPASRCCAALPLGYSQFLDMCEKQQKIVAE